jgi:hypothetical protein
MEMDTGPAPNALCAYECTARAAGIAMKKSQELRIKNQEVSIKRYHVFIADPG